MRAGRGEPGAWAFYGDSNGHSAPRTTPEDTKAHPESVGEQGFLVLLSLEEKVKTNMSNGICNMLPLTGTCKLAGNTSHTHSQ